MANLHILFYTVLCHSTMFYSIIFFCRWYQHQTDVLGVATSMSRLKSQNPLENSSIICVYLFWRVYSGYMLKFTRCTGLALLTLNRHESLHRSVPKKADKVLVTEDKCCDTVCGGYTCGKGWQADPLKARCTADTILLETRTEWTYCSFLGDGTM